MPTCLNCKKVIKTIEKEIWPKKTYECGVDDAGRWWEKEKEFDPDEVTFCCPECGEILDFHRIEEAAEFLKGEKEICLMSPKST